MFKCNVEIGLLRVGFSSRSHVEILFVLIITYCIHSN